MDRGVAEWRDLVSNIKQLSCIAGCLDVARHNKNAVIARNRLPRSTGSGQALSVSRMGGNLIVSFRT